ncbi:MAG: hypothetical protein H3C50_06325 [Kiritimatiellae bacterium]|nr:hypothetical protein [Kiritimatiellia bacterium]MCO5061604.1 hypothetical protein [Kiritimatiellia bacterium]MCO5067390.1 hypothetical protein [Kiritimatiellia bacterium]
MKRMRMLGVLLLAGIAAAGWAEELRGGRLLEGGEVHAEFFVTADRHVELRFLDEAHKVEAVGDRVAVCIAATESGKTNLQFEARGDVLVSTTPLPEGDGYTVIIQIARAPGEKPRNFRIVYHSELCGACERPEYACLCEEGEHAAH